MGKRSLADNARRLFAIWPAASYLLQKQNWIGYMKALLVAGYVAIVTALSVLMRWFVGEPEQH